MAATAPLSLPASPTRSPGTGSWSHAARSALSASASASASSSAASSQSHSPTVQSPTAPRHLPYPFLLSPSLSQRRLTSQSAARRRSSHARRSTSSHATAQYGGEADDSSGSDREREDSQPGSRRTGLDSSKSPQASFSLSPLSSIGSPASSSGSSFSSSSSASSPASFRTLSADRRDQSATQFAPLDKSSLEALDPPLSTPPAYQLLSGPEPLWSSFASSAPPLAIHTSFINTLLLSDRSCLVACCVNFAVYFLGLLTLILLAPHLPGATYPATYHSGFWHGFHVWCCLAATLLLFVLFSTPSSKKQRISAIALCILLVCVVTYLVFALQLLPVYTDLFGHELYPLRYVEWVTTTPLMLLLVCNLDVQPRGLVLWIVAADVAMILTGLLASISPNLTVMSIWLVVSFLCELDTLTHMHSLFVQYRQLVGAFPRILLTLNFLELWLYAAYAWFPTIWCLAALGVLSDDGTNNLYFIGDTMGKLLYTAALLIINFELVDHAEQLHRVQYEAEMRIQMINEKMRSQEESRRQALVSNERKREFLRYILHEIRVPLNALVLGLEGLRSSVDSTASVEAGAADSRQRARAEPSAQLAAQRTPGQASASARVTVQEEPGEQEHEPAEKGEDGADESDEAGSVSHGFPIGEAVELPNSPHRSPLPSPTLERSPVLFSNSSILPSTTSLSRASSRALSAASSASSQSAGHPSPPSPVGASLSQSAAWSSAVAACDDDADSINEMWHAVSHMTRLLDDVLSLQRIEDGELLLERRAFSLQDTCVAAVRMMATWLDNKGLTARCDVDASLPLVVSDEYRVRQVLINFLSNAIRFTPCRAEDGSQGRILLTVKRCELFDDLEPVIDEGQSDGVKDRGDERGHPLQSQSSQLGRVVVPSAESLFVSSSQRPSASLSPSPTSSPAPSSSPRQPSADRVADGASNSPFSGPAVQLGCPPVCPARVFIRVSVHDTGVGMPLRDLQRLFTPFVQISSGESEKGKGTGLGLSICRKLVDLLGGRVGVISSPGGGSTFFFEAPFEVSADQSPEAVRPADQSFDPAAINAGEATSRTVNKPHAASTAAADDDTAAPHHRPQLVTSSLRRKRRAMQAKQKSSSDGNSIPLHPARPSHPASLALAASSTQHTLNAPASPVRMVARALTVPPAQAAVTQPPFVRNSHLTAAAAGAASSKSPADGTSVAPAASPPAAAASAASSSASSPSRPVHVASAPLRVLVVDDADSNRKLLARLVSKDGAAVCEQARDGREAVGLVQGDVVRFDVILCDKEMPVMDGYAAVREMRRLGVACPIIGVTANALVDDQAEFIACGLDALVTKPVNMRLLTAAMHDALQQRAAAKQNSCSGGEQHNQQSSQQAHDSTTG